MENYDLELDGTPEEFPHRAAAMSAYRALWASWLLSVPEDKLSLEEAMLEEQRRICRGPGRVWNEFVATLPGYEQWRGNKVGAFLDMIERAVEDDDPR